MLTLFFEAAPIRTVWSIVTYSPKSFSTQYLYFLSNIQTSEKLQS